MHWINGQWVEPASAEYIDSYNPYTGKVWNRFPRGNVFDAKHAVDAAEVAFSGEWRQFSPTERGGCLRRLADLLAEEADELAQIESQDNGKLIAEMQGQLRYVPQWYTYFGGLADKIEGAVIPTDKKEMFNFTRREPLGVVVAITPWNSPLLITAWKLAPALAAGNTVILKPSEHASMSALAFAKVVEKAGFPPGVVNVVTGYGNEVGEALINDPRVAKVSFTGGDQVGRHISEQAAKTFKHVTLELGGKSPNIVFEDAQLENAVKGAIAGIFAATGQTCIAGSRLLVQRSIYDAFVEKLVSMAKTAKMGDPLDVSTQVGPITTRPQYEKVLKYIEIAKEEGATCALGGKPVPGEGWFIEPTIFTGVSNRMRIAQEEVFGPILSIIPFEDEDEAISIANDTLYGLAAGVWTQNMARAFRLSQKLQAGTVWINTYRAVSFTSPFGGYKHSGYGRESGLPAIDDYLQTKSVWINLADEFPDPFIMR